MINLLNWKEGNNYLDIISTFSSLTRLTHVIAYCLCFKNTLKRITRKTESLEVQEIEQTLKILVRRYQAESFFKNCTIFNQIQLHTKHKLLILHPF